MGRKSKVKGISEQPPAIQNIIDQKHAENVEYFNYLCSMTTNGARCRCETKSRTIIGLMNCRTQLYGD